MYQPLERITPEQAGISSRQVEQCLRSLMHDKTEMHGFMAARHGKVFAECWWQPYGPQLVHSNHSLGKSYTATAIGILCTRGQLDLDERIIDIFADEMRQYHVQPYDKLEQLTVRHVLKMSTGMERNPMLNDDWIGEFLKQPIVYQPGERFLYNTSGACLLGAIVEKKAGMSLHRYLSENLFDKIGIRADEFVMLRFKNGYCAEPGTFSKTEDNLRLAMFYLNDGRWNGEQIVSDAWMHEAMSRQISTEGNGDSPDYCSGYGYQLWLSRIPGVYRFDGGQGQFGIIWPEKDLVVALHQGGLGPDGPQITLDRVMEGLMTLVADEPLPEDPEALASLCAFEQSLRVPEQAANTLAVDPAVFSGRYAVTGGDADADPWISVSPGTYNFFRAFFEKDKKADFTDFTLEIDEEKCVFTADGYAEFVAWFDGKYRMHYTDNPLPQVGDNCSTARYTDANTLEITIKWMHSWFENVIRFEKTDSGLAITTVKDRLQAGPMRYSIHHAAAVKQTV